IVQIQSVLNLLIYASAFVIGARYWLKGLGYTRFFSLAWAVAIVALTLINLRSREIIPTNQYTFYIYQIAVVIEVILLSLALNERSLHKQKHLIQERDYQLVEKDRNIEFLRSYESLYNNSLTGRFQLDKDGYFSKTNTSWRTIIGYNDAAFFAEDNPTFNSLFADSKQRRQFWADLKEQGKLLARVLYFTQPISGERIVVSLSMRKGSGEQAAWYGSGQDVTENYLKQQAILQMQKDKTQSLRQLVLGISHEMNTPLSNIRLARGFLDNDHPEWSEDERERRSKEGIAFIHEGIDRLNELNQLMKSSVIQENQYAGESIIIRDWLDLWSLEVKQKYPTLKLRTAVHSYLIDWPTYPEALAIVLGQLLENSCLHNKELYEKEELKVSVDFRERGDFLELHYQDNGKGVTTEQREQIFMPFFTSNRLNAQNKGLGLYQSYNLITELLQGFIDWPDEAEGFYLIVRFNLPAN
ncbi:MAG: sensor histidine kinase, partial [Venatoribacter sp.]